MAYCGLSALAGGMALGFVWGGARRGGGLWFLLVVFGGFRLVLARPLFWRGAGHWAIILWSLDTDPKS